MYSRCLVCRAPFPETGVLPQITHGDRVAYDPVKGRLWQVCRSCRRWSLVPLESRWEALEELERSVSGKAKLLSQTEHVALFRDGNLEIVRVGPAEFAEEAWWRFGRQIPDQRRLGRWAPGLFSRLRFGQYAWVGEGRCSECGAGFRHVPFSDARILVVQPGEGLEGRGAGPAFTLVCPCPRCKEMWKGGLRLSGIEGGFTLSRVLAYQSHTGASRVTVQAAARLLEDPEGPASLVRLLSRHGRPLGALQPIGLTALEAVVSAARERNLLQMEVEALQARWRREEELAALVDGVLSPHTPLSALIWKVRGKS